MKDGQMEVCRNRNEDIETEHIKNRTDRTAGAIPAGPVSLYIHFPFCVRKCRYCDFLSGPAEERIRARYLRALEQEIRLSGRYYGRPSADTIFFGGGTPSLMSGEELEELMDAVRESFAILPGAEISIECNPGTADRKKLADYRRAGINRLSVGVQSFRDEELLLLGRIHTAEEAKDCIRSARESGFSNLSLDLMSALPGQTMDEWMESLKAAAELSPEHISAYSLILEDGTPLKEAAERGELPPFPSEDLDRAMYHETERFLAQHGYHRYEISNYAKEGFESRHNSGYWTGHPYLGFGTGAASYLGKRRWSNVRSLTKYLAVLEEDLAPLSETEDKAESLQCGSTDPDSERGVQSAENVNRKEAEAVLTALREETELLSANDRMAEFMFLGLRRMAGVSEEEFRERFHCTMEEIYGPVIRRYQNLQLLARENGRLFLTRAGIDVSNTVMADFLLDP